MMQMLVLMTMLMITRATLALRQATVHRSSLWIPPFHRRRFRFEAQRCAALAPQAAAPQRRAADSVVLGVGRRAALLRMLPLPLLLRAVDLELAPCPTHRASPSTTTTQAPQSPRPRHPKHSMLSFPTRSLRLARKLKLHRCLRLDAGLRFRQEPQQQAPPAWEVLVLGLQPAGQASRSAVHPDEPRASLLLQLPALRALRPALLALQCAASVDSRVPGQALASAVQVAPAAVACRCGRARRQLDPVLPVLRLVAGLAARRQNRSERARRL